MQLRTILAVVLSMFDLEMMGDLPPASYEAMVVMPKGPNMIKFVAKKGTSSAGVNASEEDAGVEALLEV